MSARTQKSHEPPKWFLRLFERLAPIGYREEMLGDLIELFEIRSRSRESAPGVGYCLRALAGLIRFNLTVQIRTRAWLKTGEFRPSMLVLAIAYPILPICTLVRGDEKALRNLALLTVAVVIPAVIRRLQEAGRSGGSPPGPWQFRSFVHRMMGLRGDAGRQRKSKL